MPRGARGRASRMAYLARQRARAAHRAGQQRRRSQPRQEPPRRGYWAWHELSDREPDEISTVDYEAADRDDWYESRIDGEAGGTPAAGDTQPAVVEVLDGDDPMGGSETPVADGEGGPSSTALWVDELIRGVIHEATSASPESRSSVPPAQEIAPRPKPAPPTVRYKAIPPLSARRPPMRLTGTATVAAAAKATGGSQPHQPMAAVSISGVTATNAGSRRLPQFAARGPILLNDESAAMAIQARAEATAYGEGEFPPRPPLAPPLPKSAGPRDLPAPMAGAPRPRPPSISPGNGRRLRGMRSRERGGGERRRDRSRHRAGGVRRRSNSRRRSRSRPRRGDARRSRAALMDALMEIMRSDHRRSRRHG